MPSGFVDHKNQIRDDNRWSNLRHATPAQNVANSRIRSHNSSGYRGVSWEKSRGKWKAYGRVGGVLKNLGRYNDVLEAAAAAKRWRAEHFKEYAPQD